MIVGLERAPTAVPDEWLTTEEAVAYTKFSARTLQRARISGELQHGGTSGRTRYKRRWLDEWLEHRHDDAGNGDNDG